MASPFLWAVYCDPLLARLRVLGVGCHVAGMWMGAQLYCDDVLLLAPTRIAMELMIQEAWADEFNVTFFTDPGGTVVSPSPIDQIWTDLEEKKFQRNELFFG